MSLVDTFDDMALHTHDDHMKAVQFTMNIPVTLEDITHIERCVTLLCRSSGMDNVDTRVLNVYSSGSPTCLPRCILDVESFSVGEYLIKNMHVKKECSI